MRALRNLVLWASLLVITLSACSQPSPESFQESSREAPTPAGPRSQPGTEMGIYTPQQHQLYSGHFKLGGGRIYQVGRLNDPPGWDHMGNEATRLFPVEGNIEIDVDEIENTGTFVATLELPEGHYVVEMDRFHEFSPCQDGGIAAFIFEHGDSGCGDSNWPKSLLYVAGWGYGRGTLNGKPLYQDYHIHFMVTQGMRDRQSLEVRYPLLDKKTPAGAVDPAAQQIDFFIRSPETDERNNPTRAVFDHFFAMEVTWKQETPGSGCCLLLDSRPGHARVCLADGRRYSS